MTKAQHLLSIVEKKRYTCPKCGHSFDEDVLDGAEIEDTPYKRNIKNKRSTDRVTEDPYNQDPSQSFYGKGDL